MTISERAGLTDRERDVMRLWGLGLRNHLGETADERYEFMSHLLGIHAATCRRYHRSALRKLEKLVP